MNESLLNIITQRLDHLERENRRWRRLGGGALAVLSLILLLGAARSEKGKATDEIRAKRFIIVDKDGRQRGSIGEQEDNTVGVILNDQAGGPLAGLVIGGMPYRNWSCPARRESFEQI